VLPESFPRHCLQTAVSALLPALALLWSVTSFAADETQRWYDVEVIIFAQNSQQYRNSEVWPLDYGLPQLAATQELRPASRATQTAPVPFSRLDTASLRLSKQAERIKAAADTELLLHIGWRQPGLAEDKAVAVRVDDSMQDGGEPAPASAAGESSMNAATPHRLEGSLKLVLSRYLHIHTDLFYREPRSDATGAVSLPMAEADLFSQDKDSFILPTQPQFQVYHLQQSRRMRSSELHYLDHPVFGMAILVTPYEVKEAGVQP
jgi:hypothetical protein